MQREEKAFKRQRIKQREEAEAPSLFHRNPWRSGLPRRRNLVVVVEALKTKINRAAAQFFFDAE